MISLEKFKELKLKRTNYDTYIKDYKKFKSINSDAISLGNNNSTIGTALLEKSISTYSQPKNLLTNENSPYNQITHQLINNYKVMDKETVIPPKDVLDEYLINGDKLECFDCGGGMTVSNIQTRRGDESGKIHYHCENNPNHKRVKK